MLRIFIQHQEFFLHMGNILFNKKHAYLIFTNGKRLEDNSVWKVSICEVFSGLYCPTFGLNTERSSLKMGKYIPEKAPYLDTFHIVTYNSFITLLLLSIKNVNMIESLELCKWQAILKRHSQ